MENKAGMDTFNTTGKINISEEFGLINGTLRDISHVQQAANFSGNCENDKSMETLLNLERYLGELTMSSANLQSDLVVENEHLPKLRMLLQNMKVVMPQSESKKNVDIRTSVI